MKEISIEHLAYHLKQANDRDLPKPIFFLGAGASFSGKIPLANDIAAIIIKTYHDNPDILMLADADKTYSKLMGCLSPVQRNELLNNLIAAAKINVTHIYLAQLIKKNLVDFVLTANFDNLMLRALALFDIFPPVYDLTSISDFTTTTIKDKSIVYLHGQHNGTWLLNTDEEMTKVQTIVPRIFDTIKNKRPWIFLGYSGNDKIFEHIKNLGRFDNGLYWVGHDDYLPSEQVQDFLNKPNTNTHFIKGYDADAFMLKLNHELGLEQPDILDKPFSSLKTMLSNIVDIDDEDHFRGAKVRIEIARKNVDYSIQVFEDMENVKLDQVEKDIDRLKKDIIDLIISEEFDEKVIGVIECRAKKYNNEGLNDLLAELFFYLGNRNTNLVKKCDADDRENLLNTTIGNFNKSIEYMPESSQSLYNCGVSLSALAALKTGTEAEALYEQAIKNYSKALEINPEKDEALNNLGVASIDLAKFKSTEDAESLYHIGFESYRQSIAINPNKKHVCSNWGLGLSALAALKTGSEAETLYEQAIEKFNEAIKIEPNNDDIFNNIGVNSLALAALKTGSEAEALYEQAIDMYRQILKIDPKKSVATYSLGYSLSTLARIVTDGTADKLYQESFEKFQQAADENVDIFNVFKEWAIGLSMQASSKTGEEAKTLYEQAIEKYEQSSELEPNDVISLCNWGLCLATLALFKTGTEAETLLEQAIEKYEQASEIDSSDYGLLNNWGSTLIDLAALKSEKETVRLYEQATKKFKKANKVEPDKEQAISNWANTLVALAALKSEKEAEALYEQATKKFERIIEIDPDKYQILDNWGLALLMSAKNKKGEQAKELYKDASEKLEKAYKHSNRCYNLACSYARLEHTEDALRHLKISLRNKEVTVDKVIADDEWTNYLDRSDFKETIKG